MGGDISGNLCFQHKFLAKLNNFKTGKIILGGDCILNHRLDRSSKTEKTSQKLDLLKFIRLAELISQFNFLDVWRFQHSLEQDYNYYLGRHLIHTGIDFILISSSLSQQVTESAIGFKLWKDHTWTSCDILINENEHKSPKWF